ncbi:hypothetical protein LJC59_10365, partial [Desulfovibrio sp. OttesenSCG-928-A18]|nr:hypothetical protein [Desulfovibrio sp. OttesenSCG-928-A18]
ESVICRKVKFESTLFCFKRKGGPFLAAFVLRKNKENGSKIYTLSANKSKSQRTALTARDIGVCEVCANFKHSSICLSRGKHYGNIPSAWQIELVFKRLKSLLGVGHLRKQDEDSSRAWLQGKLFVAMLLETFIRAGEAFFPWGYPIPVEESEKSLA